MYSWQVKFNNEIIYYLSNRPYFLWVYRRDNPRGMSGEQAFTSFSSVLPTYHIIRRLRMDFLSIGFCKQTNKQRMTTFFT